MKVLILIIIFGVLCFIAGFLWACVLFWRRWRSNWK